MIYFISQGAGANSHASTLSYSYSYGGYTLQVWPGNNVVLLQPTITLSNNQWYHVALTHDWNGATGGTYNIYHNGTLLSSTNHLNDWWNVGNINGQPIAANIYKYNNTVGNEGYLSDWRLSNRLVYTANFTPPTEPLKG